MAPWLRRWHPFAVALRKGLLRCTTTRHRGGVGVLHAAHDKAEVGWSDFSVRNGLSWG